MLNAQIIADINLNELRDNPYPGRGIIVGLSSQASLVLVSWIMGRSDNSRNRIYVAEKGGVVRTAFADPSKGGDASLIIYNAMLEKSTGSNFVVSNGAQTDMAVLAHDIAGFYDLMREWTYEPDEPNFTPRITGIIPCDGKFPRTAIAIHRKDPASKACIRSFYEYEDLELGFGYCATTYEDDAPAGQPLPSFVGEPYLLPLEGNNAEQIAQHLWGHLNEENRVALAVKTVGGDGRDVIHIVNRYDVPV